MMLSVSELVSALAVLGDLEEALSVSLIAGDDSLAPVGVSIDPVSVPSQQLVVSTLTRFS